jgi:isopropylmalate/homocitrate/citramalate synthase
VQKIAASVGSEADSPIICGLARTTQKDIKSAADALRPAAKPRIHTFLATSDIHLQYKLKKTRQEVLEIVPEMVAYAKSFLNDVNFPLKMLAAAIPNSSIKSSKERSPQEPPPLIFPIPSVTPPLANLGL